MNSATVRFLDRLRVAKINVTVWLRTFRAACATLFFRTHVRRWAKVAQAGPPVWDKRNEIIAGLIPDGSSVLDVGSGAQTLKKHLPAGCRYQPCDCVQSSPEVAYCDFNAGIYPAVSGGFDFVVCSGVFEYLRQPKDFLKKIPQLGRTTLLSYNPLFPESSKFTRLGNNWVNHFTRDEIENLFAEMKLQWRIVHQEPLQYVIYQLHAA